MTKRARESVRFELLVVTMRQSNFSLVETMRITSDAVIANQTDYESEEVVTGDAGNRLRMLNTTTRGVGTNRNIALAAAQAEIVLFADDDVVYDGDYMQVVLDAFDTHPQADLIFFNLRNEEDLYRIPHATRVRFWSFLRYGTAQAAVRLNSVRAKGIVFDERFGGGTEHSHGEDTLFFASCLRAGLKLVAVPSELGILTNDRPSTWSAGYDLKYVRDQGALYRAMSPRWWRFWALQDVIRRSRKHYKMSALKAYQLMSAQRA